MNITLPTDFIIRFLLLDILNWFSFSYSKSFQSTRTSNLFISHFYQKIKPTTIAYLVYKVLGNIFPTHFPNNNYFQFIYEK